jgi:hypothetical protein
MSGYESVLKNRKSSNDEISSIEVLKKNYGKLFQTNFELNLKIKKLEEKIQINKDLSDMRFGEVYSFLSKFEKSYYNGLSVPKSADATVSEETQSQQNNALFGNMSLFSNNEASFLNTKSSDLETMKNLFI